MTLQALLVSKDDNASEALSRILAGFGVPVERSSDPEIAAGRLAAQKFDEVIVDFDQPEAAALVLRSATHPARGNGLVIVALISDESKVRSVFGAGAHFALNKPILLEQAKGCLRAATAMLKRERRRAFRVPVQASVVLSVAGTNEIEGILLDLSESGMDVLAAQPLCPSVVVSFRFTLPGGSAEIVNDRHFVGIGQRVKVAAEERRGGGDLGLAASHPVERLANQAAEAHDSFAAQENVKTELTL